MSTFDDILDQGAATDLTVLGGQSVSYTPNGGDARTITVLVDYISDDENIIDGSWKKDPVIQITALDSATTGISLASWTKNDSVSVAPRPGATAKVFHLAEVMQQISGHAVFRVN